MGIQNVQREIERFLATSEASALVVKGQWGVGKTYAWKRFLREAKASGQVAASHYSYVSLFGLGNLSELKSAIFQNTIEHSDIGKEADLETLNKVVEGAPGLWRRAGFIARLIPALESYATSFDRVGFFWVKRQLICIDDLERKSDDLPMRDILGLLSQLKDQRSCQIVLLLNEDKIGDREDRDFKNQIEKISDLTLSFAPTPKDSAGIAFGDKPPHWASLVSNCIELGIVNIRTLTKIDKMARRLEADLGQFDPRVLQRAFHSLPLFALCRLQPDDAPSIDYLKRKGTGDSDGNGANPEAPEMKDRIAHWDSLTSSYGFTGWDELDSAILMLVMDGYADPDVLSEAATDLAGQLAANDQDQAFEEAWGLYHDSFDDNADQVMEALAEAVRTAPKAISIPNLSRTIVLLKDLGWTGDLKKLVEGFVEANSDRDARFWNLEDHVFGDEIRDPDVRQAFADRLHEVADQKSAAAILISIAKEKGWNQGDLDFLSELSAEEFYNIFKSLKGSEHRRAVSGALFFRSIANASDAMKQITHRAQEALIKIAKESPINRRRVAQMGVTPAPDEETENGKEA